MIDLSALRRCLVAVPPILAALCMLAPAPAAAQVRIATLADLSGPIAQFGVPMDAAKQLAVADINAQGGVLGQTLTAIRLDSQCSAETATGLAQTLLGGPPIAAIVGPSCSDPTLRIAELVSIPLGIPQISPSATAPMLTTLEDRDMLFRMAPSDTYLGAALAGMILDRGVINAGVTFANDTYSRGVMEVFVETFRRNGGRITGMAEHVPGETDFDALIDRIAAPATDALVIFAYYDRSGTDVVRAALADGRFEIFFGSDGMIGEGLVRDVGAENLGWALFMIAASDDTTGAYQAYAARAERAGIDPAAPFTAASYDAAFLAALAIEAAGSTDPAQVQAALRAVANPPGLPVFPGEWEKARALIAAGEEIDYIGASGVVEFDPAGDTPGLVSVNTVLPDASWDVFVLR